MGLDGLLYLLFSGFVIHTSKGGFKGGVKLAGLTIYCSYILANCSLMIRYSFQLLGVYTQDDLF